MPICRLLSIAALLVLASCGAAAYNSGVSGPTGRASDAGNVRVISVRDVWKQDLKNETRRIVVARLPLGKTAIFDGFTEFEGYYDAEQDVTRVAAYGNVHTSTDYGTTVHNGYYVIWEQPGKVTTDFPQRAWKLVDVEITDQPY